MSTKDPDLMNLNRRQFLAGTGAVVAFGSLGLGRAFAADGITVADPGGVYVQGFGEAFYKPFRALGNTVNVVARDAEPTSQVKAMVEAKAVIWDVVSVTRSSRKVLADQGLLETLDITGADWDQLIPLAREPDWMGTNVYGFILAYNRDTMKAKPKNWADFYNVKDFPGRRSLPKSPIQTLEGALLADGVKPSELYPLDVDRAFKKLDEIKPHIDVWWASYTQCTQLLQSGEIDFLPTSNARAQAAIDGDAPIEIIWEGALFNLEGWAIPKGSKNVEAARRFIAFCANGARQALYTKVLAYGPTNQEAFKSIPAERAKDLPTEPSNFAKMVQFNDDWWGVNKDKMYERYNAWLLK